jgi:uncharacterized membrane protein YozB (DUF420 family)
VDTGLATIVAPSTARFTLVAIIVAVVLLTVGWRLAVARRYTAHAAVQISAVVVITALAVTWMLRSLRRNVLPGIPSSLGHATYAVAATHAVVGAAAAAFGIFVVLAATKVLPPSLRFHAFRPFMRVAYGLYLLAAALGVVYYVVAYGFSFR